MHQIPGERYEYEMNALMTAAKEGIPILVFLFPESPFFLAVATVHGMPLFSFYHTTGNKYKEISNLDYSVSSIDPDAIINSMKNEQDVLLKIRKIKFDIKELYCADTCTFISVGVSPTEVKESIEAAFSEVFEGRDSPEAAEMYDATMKQVAVM